VVYGKRVNISSLLGVDRTISGVTFTNSLSVAEHVHAVISSSAHTLYALRVLRAHGMNDVSLQTIFRSVVIAKLMHASSAWWGFGAASDRQRLAAFIRRSDRSRFVPANLPTIADLCHNADEKMFAAIASDRNHVLHYLLPPQSTGSQNYNLRQRTHKLLLSLLELVISLTTTLSNACYISTYFTLYFNSLTELC